mmetsp:Transcript_49557/g.111314  ORF Transcript_49557/g.111314 Transcript_49557/m.111314 type:complete len:738 (+) Transcript_49557:72-2285(+)
MQLLQIVALLSTLLLSGVESAGPTSVGKVVQLLQDMKKTVEKESDADANAYEKYSCWCKTSKKEKTEAVEVAEIRIADAEAELEKLAGLMGEMKTEIEELTKNIAEDEESLEAAAALRAKENEEYKAAAADMTETVSLLTQAIEVLSKVQLVQKSHRDPALLQLFGSLKTKLTEMHPSNRNFRSVMQQDFFDMLNALSAVPQSQLRGTDTPSLVQQPVISVEEKGMMEKANNLTGSAANAKSYNSRSGSILGMLAEMKDEFNRDLAEATKAEEEAEAQFQQLKKAKLAEIAAATAQKKQNEKTLADATAQTAATKRDLEKTKTALSKDQEVLLNLERICKDEEEAFNKRTQNRALELQALSEAIKMLTEDDARALFDSTVTKELSFLQLSNARSKAFKAEAALIAKRKAAAVGRTMRKILHVAAKNQDWSLASMAIHMSLDSFTKVKAAMDTMVAELKKQQAEESEKWEFCKSEIDSTEDQIKVKNIEKEDLEEEKHGLENSVAKLEADIEELNKEVGEMSVSLKAAGEDRKAENLVFQQSLNEQRQTANILRKALTRLQAFYTPNSTAFTQIARQEPGAALATPPPKPSTTAYRKSEGAGGVLQLMIQILGDVEAAESELQIDEQHAQEDYATFAADATAAIEAKRASIAEKTRAKEESSADLSETEESLLSNSEEITSLEGTLQGLHLDCDFLLKYYKVRQTARSEEMGAIAEAKAILSGAGIDEAEEAGEAAEV